MSDGRLRELERRFGETGAADDEAALLLERRRIGALTSAQLELAAYCGHAAARLLVGPGATPAGDLDGWLAALPPVPSSALARAALALVDAGLGAQRLGDAPLDEAPSAHAAARRWLSCPCASHHGEVLRFSDIEGQGSLDTDLAAGLARVAGRLRGDLRGDRSARDALLWLATTVAGWLGEGGASPLDAVARARAAIGAVLAVEALAPPGPG